MQPLTPIVKNIIIINVLLFLAASANIAFMDSFVGRNYLSDDFRPWQIITHMFMHADLRHILFNMFGVYFFGTALERYFGPKRFITFYMICGIVAFLLYQITHFVEIQMLIGDLSTEEIDLVNNGQYNPNNPATLKYAAIKYGRLVGASGAVFGLLIGFAVKFPDARIQLLFPPIPLSAKQLAIGYAAFEIFMAYQNSANDNVAHLVHLFGGLVGFLVIKYWQNKDNSNRLR